MASGAIGGGIKLILLLLPRLLDWVDDLVRKRQRKKRQRKRDEAARNPGSAMADHFSGGMSGNNGDK